MSILKCLTYIERNYSNWFCLLIFQASLLIKHICLLYCDPIFVTFFCVCDYYFLMNNLILFTFSFWYKLLCFPRCYFGFLLSFQFFVLCYSHLFFHTLILFPTHFAAAVVVIFLLIIYYFLLLLYVSCEIIAVVVQFLNS